ncbi:ABC transporter permease [Humibacter ginsenosidimutans]|uniref:ABC transporter permease n=1 Tax=Humibacter ginsenosidimutans TaxID=2599293 RepID=A0A5B8M6L8_9MICO|nr:FtsX-like permease family protein [Humibacter ginsenosidimutans]QDZ15841.1 ABC transporter permease [Humibacter ginsenosidimutans]
MKTGDLIASAVANTFRSKLRTTLTVIAIFIGAFTLTLTSAIGTGISDYITTQVGAIGATNSLTVTKTASAQSSTGSGPQKYDPDTAQSASGGGPAGLARGGSAALSADDITAIKNVDGITSASGNTGVDPSWISYSDNGKWVLSLNAVRNVSADLASGAQLDNTAGDNQIVLPTTYLHNLGLGSAKDAVGKTVTIGIGDYLGTMHQVQATIVGIQNATLFTSGASVNDTLRSALETAQTTGKPTAVATTYGSATATFAKDATPQQIAKIKADLKDAGFTGLTIDDQLGSLLTVINGIVGVLDAFAVIALIAAGFGIVNTLLMSVQERTREIGLMKAMGMGGGRVFALFSMEAVFIGFLGSAIGALAAIGLGTLISNRLSATLLSDLPGLHLLQFSVASVATIIVVVMAISFVAGTLPARRASRQDPIEALRYE